MSKRLFQCSGLPVLTVFLFIQRILYVSPQVLCDQYWPLEQGTACFGLFQVTTLERKRGPDYFITTIHLRHVSPSYIIFVRLKQQEGDLAV